ncbi:MAG: GntR family transcriptional regulator [Rhodobacteraceae bacterium]|nr:GntR family transcriptional regulator [Paracoccaceae bacterium]
MDEMIKQEAWLRANAGPRYLQFSRHLSQLIKSGVLAAEASLPSEREMAQISDMSRVTIRKAIEVLVADKLVVQRRGSGTFVAPRIQKLEHSLSRLTSFTEDMLRRGKSSSSEVIASGLFTPSPEEIVALGLRSGELVARIERLRRADGVPLAIERSSLPRDILPDPSVVTTSLYDVLDKTNCRPERAIQRISASLLSDENARLLEAETGAPALKIARTGYLPTGRVIEFTTGIYRGDAYDFVAELQT